MLITMKNKMIMALDAMIAETLSKGGIPDTIKIEPNEAVTFIKELGMFKDVTKNDVTVRYKNDVYTDISFVIQPPLYKDEIKDIINQWYKKELNIKYKGITLVIVNKKSPPPPMARMRKNGVVGQCELCESSVHRKWGIFEIDGCIQPECKNYYKK